ncbi:MFS transporter [Funiculus sociatus GB2-A5]|uniref:MFS transporter n=1 Tax=Funiculus sociatus GB2-A5 TaxID=2933946 RepID=A0ABV0JSZ7_9CYAN|nr:MULTISPECIES: MFS transporter [unclassified Trichocoleus]MBD1906910.1 MFS transporter [Trichocoleus sp. FACHB-832]MBD2063421.1 MFS transporter [Trichocoleus sp. FACHB-6]
MFETTSGIMELDKALFWIGQVTPVDPAVNTPERAALVFSGPEFFVALIAGVVLAFALQLLLTNLSVAAGISYLGHQSDSSSNDNESGSLGGTIRKIGTAVGIWTLVTVTIALAIACFLAVKLTLVSSSGLGAIIGLVIWATYFCLLFWVSSTTVGSLVGSVVNTATSGFQAIVGTATAAIGAQAVNNQVVSTAEAAAAAVRRELGSGIDPSSIRETLEDYLGALRPPELDMQKIRGEFERLLSDPQLKAIANTDNLRNIDRQTFINLVSDRTDLSKRDMNRIVDQLEGVWRQAVGSREQQPDRMGELLNYLKSAQPGQVKSDDINAKLDQLIAEMRDSKKSDQKSADEAAPGPIQLTIQQGLTSLMGLAMGRTDLSDLDVQTILSSLSKAKNKVTEQTDKLATQAGVKPELPYSTIRADVENYLLNTYSWQITRPGLNREFKEVIYDPQADPGTIRRELEQLDRGYFASLLQQRGVFTQDKINDIADQLEGIRQEVLVTVRAAEEEEKTQDLRRRVEEYIQTAPTTELTAPGINDNFKGVLEDPDADHETLERRLALYDRYALMQLLRGRTDITEAQADEISTNLEQSRDRVLIESQALQDRVKSETEALWVNLESYLRNTGKDELNPEGIQRDLKTLLSDPQAGLSALQTRGSRFDRDTLVQLLSQRQDLSEDQVNQIIDQVQNSWSNVVHAPQMVMDKAKQQVDKTSTALTDYLRNTGKDELNPEGIQRDLTRLLSDPKQGATALRQRLSQVDRDTLVKLLSQRQDLSEEQVNQVIDQVQGTIKNIVKAPRRFATRTQAQIQDFQSTLEDYLRNTGKDELNPEAIKRDLQLLLHDPRTGVESITDRLSHIDRDTMISLVSQRQDISEEEATRIVDQVLSVRDQFVEQIRSIQRRIQDTVDGIFAQIRNYLNSLDRPELNYDSIKKDVRQLFDDPQAGFDSLKDRLSHFDRNTLVAIMSSREDISEADANRLVDQIEGARNNVLQRVDRLQQQAQRRLDEVKYQAQRQAEETRKAAASAAWWLFGTAAVSGIVSAIAGALAVAGTR